MRVVRTDRAEEDLIDIWTYVALDNERAADRVLDMLERKTRLLAKNPNIGRERFACTEFSATKLNPLCSRAAAFEGTAMKRLIGKMPPVAISLEQKAG